MEGIELITEAANSISSISKERWNHRESHKRKISDEEKLTKNRERNKVHARNTRERKRAQVEVLQQKILHLTNEKLRLKNASTETSVASILMSLSVVQPPSAPDATAIISHNQVVNHEHEYNIAKSATKHTILTLEKLRSQVSASLVNEESLEISDDLLAKDKSTKTPEELKLMRKERNRIHAKKTRLRKKKMLMEMENTIASLNQEISQMKHTNTNFTF